MARFEWDRIGDISIGRENLGLEMPVAIYRLLMQCMTDELIDRYGKDKSDDIIRSIGFRAGFALGETITADTPDFNGFIAGSQRKLREYKIGILRVESVNDENRRIILTVSEDLDCSGMPVRGDTVCKFDEGMISGLLYKATGWQYSVMEVDCWSAGDRTCRFEASALAT